MPQSAYCDSVNLGVSLPAASNKDWTLKDFRLHDSRFAFLIGLSDGFRIRNQESLLSSSTVYC